MSDLVPAGERVRNRADVGDLGLDVRAVQRAPPEAAGLDDSGDDDTSEAKKYQPNLA